jgi:hypothetical protein
MAHIKSSTRPASGATAAGSGAEDDGSEDRTISGRPSDAGSHSDGSEARAESSHS